MTSRNPGPHPRRDRILAVLRETPGLGLRELSRATGIATGCLGFHLSVLARQRLVWRVTLSPRLLHYAGTRPTEDVAVRCQIVEHALDDIDQGLVHALACPSTQKAVIALYAGRIPKSTVQARLYALCRRGLLSERRSGRCVLYEALPLRTATMPTQSFVPAEVAA